MPALIAAPVRAASATITEQKTWTRCHRHHTETVDTMSPSPHRRLGQDGCYSDPLLVHAGFPLPEHCVPGVRKHATPHPC